MEVEGAECKISFFCQGEVVQEALSKGGGEKVRRGLGAKPFFRFDRFFQIQFKNTSNLISLGFKMSSERFLFKDFKTGLTFWHM